jgi:hypothetical protein
VVVANAARRHCRPITALFDAAPSEPGVDVSEGDVATEVPEQPAVGKGDPASVTP